MSSPESLPLFDLDDLRRKLLPVREWGTGGKGKEVGFSSYRYRYPGLYEEPREVTNRASGCAAGARVSQTAYTTWSSGGSGSSGHVPRNSNHRETLTTVR